MERGDTPEPDPPVDGNDLMDMVGGELPPHEAFLRALEKTNPDLAKVLRETDDENASQHRDR